VRPTDLVFDLDGVIWVGDQEIGDSGEVLTLAADAGINLLFATNNASRTRANLVAEIRTITGFEADPSMVVSSAMAGAALLGANDRTCFVVGGPGITEAVESIGVVVSEDWRTADAVIAGFSPTMAYPQLRDATLAIRRGARFIATNTDSTFPAPDGQWPGAGATVAFLVEATGAEPVVGGKPNPAILELVRERLVGDRVAVVGDRPETDLALAKAGDWIAVLALSGVTTDPQAVPDRYKPDYVIKSVAELPELFEFASTH